MYGKSHHSCTQQHYLDSHNHSCNQQNYLDSHNNFCERRGSVVECLTRDRGATGRHCVVSLSKNIYPILVLVQPRKTRPFKTERSLMGCKESNQTNKQNNHSCTKHTISPYLDSHNHSYTHTILTAAIISALNTLSHKVLRATICITLNTLS